MIVQARAADGDRAAEWALENCLLRLLRFCLLAFAGPSCPCILAYDRKLTRGWASALVKVGRLTAALGSAPCLRPHPTAMVTHEPEAASLPLPEAAELTDRENLGGRPASPPALGRAPEASTGPKRRPCQELLGVQEAAEAERCSGPPSKRWREAASIAPWQSPGEAAAPGADSCQQTRDTIQAAEQSCSRQQAGPSSAIPGAVQPGSCKEPGPGNAKQAEQAAKQADAAAADPGTPPDLHGQQPVGWPEWCDKVPTLWVPVDGQVRPKAQSGALHLSCCQEWRAQQCTAPCPPCCMPNVSVHTCIKQRSKAPSVPGPNGSV